jgi:hypothetical protein
MDTTFTLFTDWDFTDITTEQIRVKLASAIKSIKRALATQGQRRDNDEV